MISNEPFYKLIKIIKIINIKKLINFQIKRKFF